MSKFISSSAVCLLAAILLFTSISGSHGRVSKSFVRGFLVGYAKGLEEGKNLVHLQPVVHSVACTFHPIPEPEPELHIPHHEPHHEPHHIGHHEPHHEPHHHHHHHHEHGFSASNSHATNSAGQGHSTNLAASHVPPPQANGQIAPQVGPNGQNGLGVQGGISEDKKAAATSAIEKAVKTSYKA